MIPLSPITQDQRTVAERKWRSPTIAPKPQKPCDVGLFSDEADQLDLIDILGTPDHDNG